MTEMPQDLDPEQRLVILAPTQRDARITCDILERSGIKCLPCVGLPEICARLREGAAGALITEEAFARDESKFLLRCLAEQPPWSDFPIIFLARPGEHSDLARRAMEKVGNILLLERPVRTSMLVSAARAALRERRRQYMVRDQLLELDRRRTALEENEKALILAKRQAEEANRAKSEFLAHMSHEIRTPMTVFMLALQRLKNLDQDPERGPLLDMASKSAAHLRTLIDDILDFSQIEARQVRIEKTPISLRPSVENAADLLSLSASQKNIDLQVDIDPAIPGRVMADHDRLSQVLVNLVGNAVKFTHQGEVRVRVRMEDLRLHFAVTDTGPGIPPEKQDLLFRHFSQVDSSPMRKKGGTGLGLAICKGLVELMGGEIGVDSQPGAGSTFWFTLPLQVPSAEAGSSAKKICEAQAEEQPRRLRILLAEDDEMIRQLVSMVLEKEGCNITAAADGRQAVDIFRPGDFDIVFLDMHMPEMGGMEASREIRRLEQDADKEPARIIALTADVRREVQDECKAAGMDSFLTKPLDLQALFATLNHQKC